MNDNTSIAIIIGLFFISISGCFYGVQREQELTQREQEKTKQLQIQAKIDSLQIVTNQKSN